MAAPSVLPAELISVAESADVGLVLFDPGQNLRLVNARFAEFVGAERSVLAQTRTWRVLASSLAEQFRDPQCFVSCWSERMLRAADTSWDEVEILRPVRRVLERFGRPVRDAAGTLLGRLEVYRDVSGPQVRPESLQADKMEGLGRLVSGIAHELNNPLTSIMGYSQLLIGKPLAPSVAQEALRIHQEAERASQIVKSLLLFAREAAPERQPVDLNDIVRRTAALRSYELHVENIALDLELGADMPRVLADPMQMQQAVLNLILNAQQAVEGSVHGRGIRVRTWSAERRQVFLEISDSGTGIAPEILHRVFDPFFTTKPVGAGTGLGLSIVHGIVRDHGGQISAESPAGAGARFLIVLPALPQSDVPSRTVVRAAVPRKFVAAPLRGERALVVEDEPTVAQLIADVLGEQGHLVDTFLDSQEALDRALTGRYELVICDLKMPNLDGRAFYRELVRRNSPLQHRMIFVTGDTLATRTMEFLETSGVPYLAKPFLVENLKATVAQALAHPAPSSGAPVPRIAGRASESAR